MRVLLVEDDSATAQMIELMLKSEGFNVYTTDLGEEAIDLGKIYDYDIILLNLNLPDISGFDVIRSLRVAKIDTPIMIVSGTQTIDAKVKALGMGADDYLTKPFHKDEMVARIHVIVRRSKGHALSVIKTGGIVVNLDDKTVEVVNTRLHLTGKEYQMLELLALRKGTTLTKEMFLNHLYGGMDEPELKIIDVFICKLRKKISKANNGSHHIETVWGRGYVLRDPPAEAVAEPFANEEDPVLESEPEPVNEDVGVCSEVRTIPDRYRYMTVKEKVACALIGQQPMGAKEILDRVHQHIDPWMICQSQKTAISRMKDSGLLASTGYLKSNKYALTPKGIEWIEKIDGAGEKSLVA